MNKKEKQKTEIKIEPNTKDHHSLLDSEFLSAGRGLFAAFNLKPAVANVSVECEKFKSITSVKEVIFASGSKKKPLYSHALIGKINTATVHLIFSLMRHVSTVFPQQ